MFGEVSNLEHFCSPKPMGGATNAPPSFAQYQFKQAWPLGPISILRLGIDQVLGAFELVRREDQIQFVARPLHHQGRPAFRHAPLVPLKGSENCAHRVRFRAGVQPVADDKIVKRFGCTDRLLHSLAGGEG